MNKNKQTEVTFNGKILTGMAKKHGVSKRNVWQVITGERTPVYSEEIKKEYLALLNLVPKLIDKQQKELDLFILNYKA